MLFHALCRGEEDPPLGLPYGLGKLGALDSS